MSLPSSFENAARKLAGAELSRLQKAVLQRFMTRDPFELFEDFIDASNAWDEFCWSSQRGIEAELPENDFGNNWTEFLEAAIADALVSQNRNLLLLAESFARDAQEKRDGFRSEAPFSDLIAEAIENLAANQNLERILTGPGSRVLKQRVESPISSGGMIWSFLLEQEDGNIFATGILDQIESSTDEADFDIAISVANKFFAEIDGLDEESIVIEIVRFLRAEIRELLIERDILPSISDLRAQ